MAGGGTFKKIGHTISRGSQIIDPVGGTLTKKGIQAAGMNPDDPLKLDKAFGPKIPGEDPAVKALRDQQAAELADLNNQENSRIKKLLYAGRAGARGYRGGPLFRARPSNTAGAGTAARAGSSAAGSGAAGSAAAAAFRAGGIRGGLRRGAALQ
jgi:hypothetical protein